MRVGFDIGHEKYEKVGSGLGNNRGFFSTGFSTPLLPQFDVLWPCQARA